MAANQTSPQGKPWLCF